jgi:hypothetical protein
MLTARQNDADSAGVLISEFLDILHLLLKTEHIMPRYK